MSSYQYPQHILHRVIEPQWFPDRKEETESTLTAIEMAEEAHALYLQKIVTEFSPTAGAVIIGQRVNGRSGTPTGRRNRQQRRTTSTGSSSETGPAGGTPGGGGGATTTTPSLLEDPVAILSPPPMSASQRFWNRTIVSRRSSSGTTRTEIRQQS